MRTPRLLVTLAMTGALVGGGLVGATSASAATCYSGATSYEKSSTTHYVPGGGKYHLTGPNCADINIKMSAPKEVKVCFYKKSADGMHVLLNYCQSSYKLPKSNKWLVVASNVKNNVLYKFYFKDISSKSLGWYAD
ncbi:hypothetical protein [Streptomyces tailanensis]|uniref:hypothetical protein n=1 Tax=Streptomyces tailanensis TaxID=2569858 RepID=UPI00122E3F3D|nr:hypothetical protein [Streptomyces tailanensis]